MRQAINLGIFLLIGLCSPIKGQAQHVYSQVNISPNHVYTGQPCRYTVKIFTDTWFTDGAKFEPLTLSNAFVVPAQNQVGSERRNGKTYSYVAYHYWIYPFSAGTLQIPPQKVVVFSPAPGQFKGEPIRQRVAGTALTVMNNPPNVSSDQWLVAQNISRKETWSRPVKHLKVGEVIERTVNIKAMGTMAAFLPALLWETTDGISTYPQSPKRTTHTPDRSEAIYVQQEQTVAYLFEKEGAHELPAVPLGYWSVKQHRWIDQSLPAIKVVVLPNDDPALLATQKKSLEENWAAAESTPPTPALSDGWEKLNRWLLIGFLIVVVIGGGIFRNILRWVIKTFKTNWQVYQASEYYAFKKTCLAAGDNTRFYTCLYRWIKFISAANNLEKMVQESQSKGLTLVFEEYQKEILGPDFSPKRRVYFLKKLRKTIKGQKGLQNRSLNP